MDAFLDDSQSKSDQEVIDYDLAWHWEILKVEKVAGGTPRQMESTFVSEEDEADDSAEIPKF